MARTGRGKEKNAAKALAENAKAMADKAQAESLVLITKSALNALLNDSIAYKEKIDGLVGELRDEIKNAADKKHLHKEAFADLKRYANIKSNEKLRSRYLSFLAYLEMSGVMKRIDSVQDLPLDGDGDKVDAKDAASDVDGDEGAGGEVVKPQFGGRRQRAADPVH